MRIIPKATNSIVIELRGKNEEVIGIYEIHDMFNYTMQINITKKVPDKDGNLQITKMKIKKTTIGVEIS